MPYIISLKEPIRVDLESSCSERYFDIEADYISAGQDVPDGLLKYVIDGKINFIAVSNLLGTYFVKEELKEIK